MSDDEAAPDGGTAGPGSLAVPLALVFLVASTGFFVAQQVLTHAADRSMELPGGIRCADGGNFYRSPCPQQFAWVWISSAYLVFACIVGVISYRWRRSLIWDLGGTNPGHSRLLFHAQHPANVLVPGVFGLVLMTQFLGLGQYGSAFHFTALDHAIIVSPLGVVILAAGLPMVSIFDIHSVAVRASRPFIPPNETSAHQLAALRRLLDRFLFVLGTLLGVWLITSAASGEYIVTVTNLAGDEATANGPLIELTVGKTVIAGGVILSALLALLYVPTALAVDDLAGRIFESRTKQLDHDQDERTAQTRREDLRAELQSGKSVADRFYAGLSIAAPLASAVFTTFVL